MFLRELRVITDSEMLVPPVEMMLPQPGLAKVFGKSRSDSLEENLAERAQRPSGSKQKDESLGLDLGQDLLDEGRSLEGRVEKLEPSLNPQLPTVLTRPKFAAVSISKTYDVESAPT